MHHRLRIFHYLRYSLELKGSSNSLLHVRKLCLQIYWQNVVGHGLHCSILGPFFSLSFVVMSVLCCLARYSLYYSHWTDVMVGFGLGIILAVYLVVNASLHACDD